MSVPRITTKEKTLLWVHVLGVEIRSPDISLHVEFLSTMCLICLRLSLRYLVYRFLRQPRLAQRFWYLHCITLRGLP
jgi:hypothetical protein